MPAKRTKQTTKGPKGTSRAHPYRKPKPASGNKKVIVRPLGVSTPLGIFFSQYTRFNYLPLNSPVAEFNRLCKEYGWGKRDKETKDEARHEFNVAIKNEFGNLYGSDEKDVKNWHKLCHVLRIDPVPDTLRECRAAVLTKHVNLVDLVQGDKMEVQIFETESDLSEYTKETNKFFPKENAADGGVLRALRRHILSPGDHIPSPRLVVLPKSGSVGRTGLRQRGPRGPASKGNRAGGQRNSIANSKKKKKEKKKKRSSIAIAD